MQSVQETTDYGFPRKVADMATNAPDPFQAVPASQLLHFSNLYGPDEPVTVHACERHVRK